MRNNLFKRIIALCLVFTLAFSGVNFDLTSVFADEPTVTASPTYGTGSGTESDPYMAYTITDSNYQSLWLGWNGNGSDSNGIYTGSSTPTANSTIISSGREVALKMTSDIELNVSLYIQSGATVWLDLNGYNLSLAEGVYGSVIVCEGTLYLYDSSTDKVNSYEYTDENGETATYYYYGGSITGGSTSGITYNTNVGQCNGGGGIIVKSTSWNSYGVVNMYGGTIIGNETTGTNSQGGGVYVYNYAYFNMYGGAVSFNSTDLNAGGVYAIGYFNMTGGAITNNYASNYGGGLYVVGTSTMTGGVIENNSAGLGAGGVSVTGYAYKSASFTISGDALISENSTPYSGGGVFLGEYSGFYMNGGEISDNTASNGGGVAMTKDSSVFTISDGTIEDNTATYDGGGVLYNFGTMTVSGATTVIGNNSTLADGDEDETTTTANNVYIASGNAIIVDTAGGALSGTIGITLADGLGEVADYTTSAYFTSDQGYYKVVVDGKIYLVESTTFEGNDISVAYSASGIAIDYTLADSDGTALFDASDMTSGAEYTYSVTPLLGSGTFDSISNTLDVSSCGTFLVEVSITATTSEAPKTGSAILTVTKLPITVTTISTISQGSNDDSSTTDTDENVGSSVSLNPTVGTYTLSGVENGDTDTVYLDFSNAYGTIYGNGTPTETDGETQYYITVHGLALTGADSGNYELSDIYYTEGETEKSTLTTTPTVIVNSSYAYIAWPSPTDILYGEYQSASDLIGGKVVVLLALATADTDDVYLDITEYGSFEWKDADTSLQTIGNYSKSVYFALTDDTTKLNELKDEFSSDADYNTLVSALSSQIHYVSYEVEAVAVIFTVENNVTEFGKTSGLAISAKDELGKTVDESNYKIIYRLEETTTDLTDIPTTVGNYTISAEFVYPNGSTNYNYHHSGVSDSTGKQIGSYYVYSGTATTDYTLTYYDSDGKTVLYSVTGANYQDIHITPTLTNVDSNGNAVYIGWEKSDGTFYEFGARLPHNVTSNIVMTAVKADDYYTISGSVTGTDLDTTSGAISSVAVFLMQGAELIATDVTDSDGKYSFDAPDGRYTVVVLRDLGSYTNTESHYVYVNGDDVTVENIVLPSMRQNIILNVDAGFTGITANGLYKLLDSDDENTVTVHVDQVNTYSDAYLSILASANENGLTTDNVKLFFDIYATEQPAGNTTYALGDTVYLDSFDLTFYIPLSGIYQAKDYYEVYRYSYDENGDGYVDILTTKPNDDGEYIQILDDKTTLVIHAQKSAVYALSFVNYPTIQTGETLDDVTYGDTILLADLAKDILSDDDYALYKDADFTYIVTSDDGVAVIDASAGTLDVSKVGTFNISVVISESDTGYNEIITTSTLTVQPKTVSIASVFTQNKSYIKYDYAVSIDQNSGYIIGLVNNDDVYVDLSDAVGLITSGSQSSYNNYNTALDSSDSAYFAPYFETAVYGADLIGADAGNYVISSTANTYVYVTFDNAYFSWPTADYISLTETLSASDLYGGKVVAIDEDGTITEISGSFALTFDVTTQAVGTHTAYVYFNVFDDNNTDDTYENEYDYVENTTHQIEYTVYDSAVNSADDEITISGTVTGTMLGTSSTGGLSDVAVAIMQGSELIYMVETDADGKYSFDAPAGRYTLIVYRDMGTYANVESVFVDATSDGQTVDVALADVRHKIILSVDSSFGGVTADGLSDILGASEKNTIRIYVDTVDTSGDAYSEIADEAEGDGYTDALYLDINATKRGDGAVTSALDSFDLDFYVPLESSYQDKDHYYVYKYVDGEVITLTTTANSDGEYFAFADNGKTLVIYAKEAGVYALAFKNDAVEKTGGTLSDVTYGSEIDLSDYVATILGTTYDKYTYDYSVITVTAGTGTGEYNEDGTLDVTKVGTFKISVTIPESVTGDRELIVTSVLTVVPKEISVESITTVSRGYVSGNSYVDIASGTLSGVVDGDDVALNFSGASSVIDDSNNETGSKYDDIISSDSTDHEFAVSISYLSLTGTDASNYTLVSTSATSTVTINASLPLFSWPTGTDILYGQNLDNSTLYGGKVFVNASGTYINITEYGEFEWVSGYSNENVGSYSNGVKFVIDDYDKLKTYLETESKTTYDTAVYETLTSNIESQTHSVNYDVLADAVSFTITDNVVATNSSTVTKLSTLGVNISAESSLGVYDLYEYVDYNVIYYYWDTDGALHYDIDEIDTTTAGVYLIGIEFTSDNYHHTGTSESTAKQIGVLYVQNTDPDEYVVSFAYADGTAAAGSITTIKENIINLPTLDDNDYIGWTLNGTSYDFGGRYSASSNVTFTAVSAPVSYSVSGTIYGTELGSATTDGTDELSYIAVALMQGSEIIATTTTVIDDPETEDINETGTYTFENIEAGRYTIVVTRYETNYSVISDYIEVADDVEGLNFTLSDYIQNVTLDVASGVGGITVSGMSSLPDSAQDSSVVVSVGSADIYGDEEVDYNAILEKAEENDITTSSLKSFYSINIAENGSAVTELDENTYLDFYIPLISSYQNQDYYYVYRYHGDTVDVFEVMNEEELTEEYLADETTDEYAYLTDDGSTIVLHVRKFSLYGLAFYNDEVVETTTSSSSSGGGLTQYVNVSYDLDGGSGDFTVSTYGSRATFSLPSEEPTKSGYEFTGWTCSVDGEVYGAGDRFTLTAVDVVFTAGWNAVSIPYTPVEIPVGIAVYSVSYDSVGGNVTVVDSNNYAEGAVVNISSASLTKFFKKFVGWENSADGVVYSAGSTFVMADENVTMTAVWGICWICWLILLIIILIILWIIIMIIKRRKKDDEHKQANTTGGDNRYSAVEVKNVTKE